MNEGIFGFPKALIGDLKLWLTPVGAGMDWWGDEADVPKGYILAYGQDISSMQYPKLYRMWFKGGVHKYGAGSTSNMTKAPDRRGRGSVGKDNMGGTAANRVTTGGSGIDGATIGSAGGAETVSLSSAQNAAHAHVQQHNPDDGLGGIAAIGFNATFTDSDGTRVAMSDAGGTISTQSSGSGTAHQNMSPSIVCNYIIRAG